MKESHAAEVEKIKADMPATADSSQSEQLQQLMASHK